MRNIIIFYGPTKVFNNEIINFEETLNLFEMIKVSDKKQQEEKLEEMRENHYESFVAYSKDFAGLSDSGERTLHQIIESYINLFDIKNIFLQNPTTVIEEGIKLMVENNKEEYDLSIVNYEYPDISKDDILGIYHNYSEHIIGQKPVEKELLTALYTMYKKRNDDKPLVLMFYGPSGVGKTETANFINKTLNGEELFRTQVSMFQNQKSIDCLFGESHNTKSFALDLLERESNVILLDEFDKTFETVYSAFYQMFDEGVFKDQNYRVNLNNTIIICTSNYRNTDSIRKSIGAPLYFRFNKLIEFQPLSKSSVLKIIDLVYNEVFGKLDIDEKKIISDIRLLDHVKSKTDVLIKHSTPNYRRLKNIIENLINTELVNNLIIETKEPR